MPGLGSRTALTTSLPLTHLHTTAPDALGQVKKGLKGLFSRKKRPRSQAVQEAPGAPSNAAYSSAGETTASSYGAEQVTHAGTGNDSTVPQILEPLNVEESRNINLDPSSEHNLKSAPTNASVDHESILPKLEPLEPKLPAEGMSATSGPLSDDLGYGGTMSSPTEDKQLELPNTEAITKLEGKDEIVGGTGTGHTAQATEEPVHAEEGDVNKALPAEPSD
ncbi:hypothetical protein MMC18_008514 [Xylographa bjoerkii]|nr:hypothetical protein [Xylographa bjoerkii]